MNPKATKLPESVTGARRAARACGAVVITFNVAVALDAFKVTCTVELDDPPLAKLQDVSFAVGSGEQESVTVPVKPPLGATVSVVEPVCPGVEMTTAPAGVIPKGPATVRVAGIGEVAGV